MATAPHDKRVSPPLRPAPSTHKHAPHAYVYSPVSPGARRHFVHRNGGGDQAVAWVAERQLGLGTTEQLEAAGIGRGAIAVRAAGLPVPLINHPVIGFNADIYRPEVGLIVEVDGGDFHRPRPAFERDHRRDIVHTDGGHEVLRVSGQQIDREPIYIAAVIVRAYERLNRGRG